MISNDRESVNVNDHYAESKTSAWTFTLQRDGVSILFASSVLCNCCRVVLAVPYSAVRYVSFPLGRDSCRRVNNNLPHIREVARRPCDFRHSLGIQ